VSTEVLAFSAISLVCQGLVLPYQDGALDIWTVPELDEEQVHPFWRRETGQNVRRHDLYRSHASMYKQKKKNSQNNGRPEMTDRRWRPEMTDRRWRPEVADRRWRPDMTESPSTSSGQSSVLCRDGLPVYREILRPYNAVIQSVYNLHLLSIHIFQQVTSPD